MRALLRHRAQLVRLRALLCNRVRAILAGHGHGRPAGCWSGPGRAWLAALELPAVSREVTGDALALTGALQQPAGRLDAEVRRRAKAGPGVKVLTRLPGVGMFTALVLLAETGDITRFGSARKLASWAGLTPTVRGSDRTVHHGHISKQGPAWVRWVACEAAQTARWHPDFAPRLGGPRPPPREEDRRHRGRPQAPHPCLPSAHRSRRRRCARLAGRVASPGRARKFA